MNALRWVLAAVAVAAVAVAIWLRQSVPDDSAHHLTPVKIALVTSGSGPYWQIAVSGAKAAARELSVDLEVGTPSGSENLQEQTEILGRLAEGGVRGVAVSPINAEGQVDAINQLADQGLKVVTFDSDAPESKRQGYVGTSNFAAGRVCGRLAAEALPGGGKIAVLAANRTKDNLIDRMGGLQEVLARLEGARTSGAAAEGDDAENDKQAAEPLEIVDFYIDDGNDEKCASLIRQALADHPDLACFIGLNARHGPVLLDVLGAEGKLGEVKIITFDEHPKTLEGIADGHIFATLAQDPYLFGYEAVRMVAKLCRGGETEQPIGTTTFSVSVETVQKDNLDVYRNKLKSRRSEDAANGGK